MPIYEYKCASCGNNLEVMQKISEEPLTVCPQCQGKLEKQWSLSGFQFKGSGWYVSDYTNRGVEPKSEAVKEGVPETKSESKTESDSGGKTAVNGDSTKTSVKAKSTADSPQASKPETKPVAKPD